jgi:hypothetical protein
MEQEYTTSTGYKIFYGAAAAALIIFTFVIYVSVVNGDSNNEYHSHVGLLALPVLGFAGAILIVINLIKRKIVISDGGISYANIWGAKEISYKDIKGFRVGEKAIFIIPVEEGYSKLMIKDYASIGDDKGFKQWLAENFKDLDKEEFEEAKKEILQDAALGATEQDREQVFNNARKYTMVYNMIGLGFFVVPLFLHFSSVYLSLLLLVYPAVGLFIMARGKGLIRLFAPKNSAYVAIFMGILLPSFGAALQVFSGVKILNFDSLWVPAGVVAIILFAVLYFLSVVQAKATLQSQVIFILIIGCSYALGIVFQVNCNFDNSTPQVFQSVVIDEHITHGKSTSYHLILGECGAFQGNENISVSSSFYDSVPVGTKLNVYLKKGALNAPWFYVKTN